MCDGWTLPTKIHIINFLIYSNRDTIFYKSIDSTNVLIRDANYYMRLVHILVEKLGPSRVLQVATHGKATMKTASKKLLQIF